MVFFRFHFQNIHQCLFLPAFDKYDVIIEFPLKKITREKTRLVRNVIVRLRYGIYTLNKLFNFSRLNFQATLSPEEEAEYHEGFKLFDKKNQNCIDKADLGTVMRSLSMISFLYSYCFLEIESNFFQISILPTLKLLNYKKNVLKNPLSISLRYAKFLFLF